MKRKHVIIILIILFVLIDIFLLYLNLKEKNNQDSTELKKKSEIIDIKDLTYEYDSTVYLKDILNIEITGTLNTEELGEKIISVKSNKDDRNIYNIYYKVVDTTPPLIMGSTTKTTTKGKSIDLVNKYLCGDNYDAKPKCYIEGDYNINKLGTYNLKYIAEDSNGNKSTKDIVLKVVNKTSSTSNNTKKTPIEDYIKQYKKENTKIGIDVSSWQENIDWQKVKNDNVEFAILRIGFGHNSNNELVLDNRFENNIKEAKKVGIPIGIYFYSYAKNKEEVKEQVEFIIKNLNGQKIDLPIAFDWENWSTFNKYNVSFKQLNDLAKTFITEVEKNGYDAMLYSSAYYLNHIWKDYDKTWLAYYTNNNDFKKSYNIWQISSSGSVNGIKGNVDIDILYEDKNIH